MDMGKDGEASFFQMHDIVILLKCIIHLFSDKKVYRDNINTFVFTFFLL